MLLWANNKIKISNAKIFDAIFRCVTVVLNIFELSFHKRTLFFQIMLCKKVFQRYNLDNLGFGAKKSDFKALLQLW
jgi:hypothetical protein